MKALFLDESGDHNLTKIDPQYPVFVLGGVIVERNYAEGPLQAALDEFKREVLGNANIILHTADITRNRNGFERMKEAAFRRLFLRRLNSLMRSLSYSVVACVIRKDHYIGRYGATAIDPYLLGFDVLVERFCWEMGQVSSGGVIIAERREATLDRLLEAAWSKQRISGTRYMRASQINSRITGLEIRAKQDNIAGLQLADLVVSPIGRHILGKPDREDWSIVEEKLWRNARAGHLGEGLTIIP